MPKNVEWNDILFGLRADPQSYAVITLGAAFAIDGELREAEAEVEQLKIELSDWQSVFGHLSYDPDEAGNMINEKMRGLEAEVKQLRGDLGAAMVERDLAQHSEADNLATIAEAERLKAACEAIRKHEDYLVDMNWIAADVAEARCRICGAVSPSEDIRHRAECPFAKVHDALGNA